MQVWIGTAMSRVTLSRIRLKIFCTKASSCCLNSRAGYLASMSFCSVSVSSRLALSPWGASGEARPKMDPERPKPPNRLAPMVMEFTRFRDPMPESEGGLMYRRKRESSVTVFDSQYDRTSLFSCCLSRMEPMVVMIRSKTFVRSALKACQC